MLQGAEKESKESDLCTEIVSVFGLFTLYGSTEIKNSLQHHSNKI